MDSLDRSISKIRGVWLDFLLLPYFIEMLAFNTNGVDPDQTLRSGSTVFATVPFVQVDR